MATWPSHPVANRQGGAFWDFSRGGGAAFHKWLTCYLGPLLPAVSQRRHCASDPATLQRQTPGVSVVSSHTQSVPQKTQLPRPIPSDWHLRTTQRNTTKVVWRCDLVRRVVSSLGRSLPPEGCYSFGTTQGSLVGSRG